MYYAITELKKDLRKLGIKKAFLKYPDKCICVNDTTYIVAGQEIVCYCKNVEEKDQILIKLRPIFNKVNEEILFCLANSDFVFSDFDSKFIRWTILTETEYTKHRDSISNGIIEVLE